VAILEGCGPSGLFTGLIDTDEIMALSMILFSVTVAPFG
jgi:hypothetical protein